MGELKAQCIVLSVRYPYMLRIGIITVITVYKQNEQGGSDMGKAVERAVRIMAAAVVCAGAVFLTNAHSADAKKAGDYVYNKKGKEAIITRYTGKAAKVEVPARIKGLKVKEIGRSAFKGNAKIKKVTLPDNIKMIYRGAFEGCKNLTEVKLPEKLEKLYGHGFRNCVRLKKVKFGSRLKVIGESCFEGCSSLERITLPEKITDVRYRCFADCMKLKNINLENITDIGHTSFENCVSLEGNIVLDNVTQLWIDSFKGCTGITGVRFSEALEVLGDSSVVAKDSSLRDIKGVGSSNPFGGCTALQNIEIAPANPNYCSVDGILYGKSGEWLVAYPAGRTGEYTVPDNVKGIGSYAFMGSRLTKINLPDSVKCIYRGAFSESSIMGIRLPDSANTEVLYYGNDIFENCKCLENVVLPYTLKNIPDSCFKGCTSLRSINLEDVESIGMSAFEGCKALEGKLNLMSAEKIYVKAFEGCERITEVALSVSASAIGIYPDPYMYDIDEYIDSVNNNNPFGNCTSLSSITIDRNNDKYTVLDGVLYSKDMEHLISVPCARTGKIIVPYGVGYINPYAFCGSMAETVVLSGSVSEICYNAYADCRMKRITIGKNVERIDNAVNEMRWRDGVFPGCSNLEEIEVKEGNSWYASVKGVLYELQDDDHKILACYPQARKGKTFTTPKNTYIASGAFGSLRYLKKLVISPKTKVRDIEVILNNCKGVKVYIPPVVKNCVARTITDRDAKNRNYAIVGPGCSKCKVYIKKKSVLAKKLVKYGYNKKNMKYTGK